MLIKELKMMIKVEQREERVKRQGRMNLLWLRKMKQHLKIVINLRRNKRKEIREKMT